LAEAFPEFALVVLLLPHWHQRHRLLGAAVEHAVEGIIIPHGDRIILVIMTTRTGYRQAHRPARQHINTIINDVMLHSQKTTADGQKTQRRQVSMARRHRAAW